MNTTPDNQSTHDPQTGTNDSDNPPSPSEVLVVVLDWLRHYWDVPRQKSKWTEIATVVLTLIIAGAALWSAWIFEGQWRDSEKFAELAKRSADAAKSSADSAEKTFKANGEQFRISERPYISAYVSTPNPPQPLMYKPGPQSVDVKLRLTNLGKTPAMKVRFVCEAYTGTGLETRTRFRAFPRVTDFTLGFGEEREVPFLIIDMDEKSYGRIFMQDTIFIFKGTVKYIDIFKENDATDFCFFYNAGPDPMRGFIECEWSEKGKGEGKNEIR